MREPTNNYELLCFDPKTSKRVGLDSIKYPKLHDVSTSSFSGTYIHVEHNGSVQFDFPFIKTEDGTILPKSLRQAVLNERDTRALRHGKEFDFYIMFDCDIGAPTVMAWKLPRG